MSLLTPNTPVSLPLSDILPGDVARIKAAPRRLADIIYQQWDYSFDSLWVERDGITPAMRLEAIGTDAAELFAANLALVQFVVAMLTGKDDALVASITAKMATIPAHIVNEDGTVTLN